MEVEQHSHQCNQVYYKNLYIFKNSIRVTNTQLIPTEQPTPIKLSYNNNVLINVKSPKGNYYSPKDAIFIIGACSETVPSPPLRDHRRCIYFLPAQLVGFTLNHHVTLCVIQFNCNKKSSVEPSIR